MAKTIFYILVFIFILPCACEKVTQTQKKQQIEERQLPSLSINPFNVCPYCITEKEIDSFELSRGAVLLKIDKKKDVLFFYEFGFLDDEFTDTLSNIEYEYYLRNVYYASETEDTIQRGRISEIYKVYFYKDSVSGLKQMTLYYSPFNKDDYLFTFKTFIYLNNKIFDYYTKEDRILNVPKNYLANLVFVQESFHIAMKNNSVFFDTSTYYVFEFVEDPGWPKEIPDNKFIITPIIKNQVFNNDVFEKGDLKLVVDIAPFYSKQHLINMFFEILNKNFAFANFMHFYQFTVKEDYSLAITRGDLLRGRFGSHPFIINKNIPTVHY